MTLSADYQRQFVWREWPRVLDALPSVQGQTVLDLGCGVGDLAAELVARGARVVGVDRNEELLQEARSRQLENAEFRLGDLRALPDLGVAADGLWCSFGAAYFPDLLPVLTEWVRLLKPGGWVALTEVDDLFGHEPLSERTQAMLQAYAADALSAGRYDFHMGRKLRTHLERAWLTVTTTLTLDDAELALPGPARPEVLEAWRARFARMTLLRSFCGPDFEAVQQEFLACLASPDHRSLASVVCCLATKPGPSV